MVDQRSSILSIRTVERTVGGRNVTFDDEEHLPALTNLAGHTRTCTKKQHAEEAPAAPEAPAFNFKASADMMRDFLRDGELNPGSDPTQAGFNRIFSVWVLDESMAFTAGQAPTLGMLFKYLGIKYALPTDTTVRNQLAKIFMELHGKVVREFAVRPSLALPIVH